MPKAEVEVAHKVIIDGCKPERAPECWILGCDKEGNVFFTNKGGLAMWTSEGVTYRLFDPNKDKMPLRTRHKAA